MLKHTAGVLAILPPFCNLAQSGSYQGSMKANSFGQSSGAGARPVDAWTAMRGGNSVGIVQYCFIKPLSSPK